MSGPCDSSKRAPSLGHKLRHHGQPLSSCKSHFGGESWAALWLIAAPACNKHPQLCRVISLLHRCSITGSELKEHEKAAAAWLAMQRLSSATKLLFSLVPGCLGEHRFAHLICNLLLSLFASCRLVGKRKDFPDNGAKDDGGAGAVMISDEAGLVAGRVAINATLCGTKQDAPLEHAAPQGEL